MMICIWGILSQKRRYCAYLLWHCLASHVIGFGSTHRLATARLRFCAMRTTAYNDVFQLQPHDLHLKPTGFLSFRLISPPQYRTLATMLSQVSWESNKHLATIALNKSFGGTTDLVRPSDRMTAETGCPQGKEDDAISKSKPPPALLHFRGR